MDIVQPSVKRVTYTKLDDSFNDSGLHVDLLPVLAARVSHGNDGRTGIDEKGDLNLMNYLAKHHHTSVFEHMFVGFKIVAPIFVVREWMRHRTQSYNEISMRYTSNNIGQLFFPEEWRKQETRNKQSSAGQLGQSDSSVADDILCQTYEACIASYNSLIELGVAREQARLVIPVGHMTEFYASGNVLNWAKFCKLRCSEDAQKEIRTMADEVSQKIREVYPTTWGVLEEHFING